MTVSFVARWIDVYLWETLQQEALVWQAQVWRDVLCGRSLVKSSILKTAIAGDSFFLFFFFLFFFSSSNQDTEHKCTIICGYKLNCGLHRCQEVCHRGNCQPCWQTSEYLNHLLLPLCSLIDFVFTNAHSIRLFLPVQTYWCYFGSQYICWFLSRFWWAGLLLWWNCHVPTYPLWHQTTRVQKPLHTPAWLWSPRYPRHTDCCSMLKQC